jgi:beta-glucosidase
MTEDQVQELLRAMTFEEQVALLSGADFWTTVPVARLGIPAIKVTDGPNGARGGGSLVGGVRAASFPVAIALAATWNPKLVEEIGAALAEEALSKGARVLLAPTVNIHRSPLNGRNFECYSEDPLLSAEIAVAYVRGVQSRGVAATVKHFAGNESEFERTTISSEIDERALREIYLPPFEAAVRKGGVWAVMTAYNKVNGTYASEHRYLLTEVLREQWGFDGLAMSDWFGSHSTAATVDAGLDLEMPGPTRDRGEKLLAAVRSGAVPEAAVRACARRVLRLIASVGAFDDPEIHPERAIDRPEHRALIRRAGAEGTVLLKNDGILPLDPAIAGKLALIGPNAGTARIMGGGSAQLNPHYSVSPFEGIAAALGGRVMLGHETGCTNYRLRPLLRARIAVEFFDGPDLSGAAVHRAESAEGELIWLGAVGPGVDPERFSARLSASFTPEESGLHQFGLVSAGRSRLFVDGRRVVDAWDGWRPGQNYFGEANDEAIGTIELEAGRTYEVVVEYACAPNRALGIKAIRVGVARPLGDQAIERAVELARTSDAALVFVGLNGEWDTEGQDRPDMDLPGRQNELVERVAAANPKTVVVLQTGGPVTMPWLADVAAVLEAWYPGQECGNAIADVLFGKADPGGRLPQSFPVRLEDNPAFPNYPGANGKVRYEEGIFVGYRHYERQGIRPLFPFGHGLSYTTFAYADLRLGADTIGPGDTLTVMLDVTNTGDRRGDEVVQIYVRDPTASLPRPEKELKGFARIALQPGETRTVTHELGMRALAFFDDAQAAWVAEAGTFEVLVGASSEDIRARASFRLTADWRQPVGMTNHETMTATRV